MKIIGLSLSFVIHDILAGEMKEDEVILILACTKFESINEAMENYYKYYWWDFEEEVVRALLNRIWHRVIQPRLWINNEEDKKRGLEPWSKYSHFIYGGMYYTCGLTLKETIRIINARQREAGEPTWWPDYEA